LIKLKNITKQYDSKKLFYNFSLDIKAGEKIVILGVSGSGKSTFLRLIAGLEKVDSGEIYLDNKLVSKDDSILVDTDKRDIGFVFQDLALWPHFNVFQNIEFGLKIKKIPKQKRVELVKSILEKVNLRGFENRAIDELSGGQKQRVALARTLVVKPKIVLMDEPLSSLDKDLNLQILDEIFTLQKELNFTLLYVTHNKSEADFLADRVVTIKSV